MIIGESTSPVVLATGLFGLFLPVMTPPLRHRAALPRAAPAVAPRAPDRLDQSVEHAVDPLAVAAVRLPLDALADEARALRVPHRALVEAVDLELEPVVAELVDEVALEEAGGGVGDPAAAEVRVDREPAEPATRLRLFETAKPIAPARSPSTSTTKRPKSSGSARPLDLLEQLLARRRAEPTGTGRRRRASSARRGSRRRRAGRGGSRRSRPGRLGDLGAPPEADTPEPSETPKRISPSPTSIATVTSSPSRTDRVEQRRDREQVRHEPGAERAEVADELHEDQQADGGAADTERHDGATAAQPGADGAWATPNGSSTTVAPSIVAVESVSVSRRWVWRCSSRLASA